MAGWVIIGANVLFTEWVLVRILKILKEMDTPTVYKCLTRTGLPLAYSGIVCHLPQVELAIYLTRVLLTST